MGHKGQQLSSRGGSRPVPVCPQAIAALCMTFLVVCLAAAAIVHRCCRCSCCCKSTASSHSMLRMRLTFTRVLDSASPGQLWASCRFGTPLRSRQNAHITTQPGCSYCASYLAWALQDQRRLPAPAARPRICGCFCAAPLLSCRGSCWSTSAAAAGGPSSCWRLFCSQKYTKASTLRQQWLMHVCKAPWQPPVHLA